MKKPLPYPPPAPTPDYERYCGLIDGLLRGLPRRRQTLGREAAFAGWLSDDDRESVWHETEDVLSHLFKGEGRDLKRFCVRPPCESVVTEICKNAEAPLTMVEIERFAGLGIGKPPQKIRTTRLITPPNKRGRSIEFALPENVPVILSNVCRVWRDGLDGAYDIRAALWILAGTLNAHPFPDGNGRVARALTNAFLIRSGILRHGPLPLGALVYAAGGNFEVAVRRVVIDGNWDQLGKVVYGMVSVYSVLLKRFETDAQAEFSFE